MVHAIYFNVNINILSSTNTNIFNVGVILVELKSRQIYLKLHLLYFQIVNIHIVSMNIHINNIYLHKINIKNMKMLSFNYLKMKYKRST